MGIISQDITVFTYLGSVVSETGATEEDITLRIAKAGATSSLCSSYRKCPMSNPYCYIAVLFGF